MSRKRIPLVFVWLVLVAISARADQLDDYIKSEMEKQHIPGLSIAIVRDGKVIRAQGYGLANVELNVPATAQTVFRIGSVSKQFIATGIMLLVEEGKVSLDDKVGKYLEGTPDTWKEITVRHLLTHTSGLVRESPAFNPLKDQNNAEIIKAAYSLPLSFATGSKWEYSNLGYFILAEIISKASGQPWPEYMADRVFKPLGMSSTRTISLKEVVPNRASGYDWSKPKVENADILIALRPSGAFDSTVLDLAKWDAALYSDRILKQSTRKQMWQPLAETTRKNPGGRVTSYGFGWFIDKVNGRTVVFHGGSQPGFRADFERFVDDKVTIIILTNSDQAKPEAIARGVAAFYITGLANAASPAR
ncbi:MAG TPA: serine hydrolase domain-containing protein [Blastocatellia bacterium]|nr:serine hydrolase domain-containing protein [Blastocatellia bacterium]